MELHVDIRYLPTADIALSSILTIPRSMAGVVQAYREENGNDDMPLADDQCMSSTTVINDL